MNRFLISVMCICATVLFAGCKEKAAPSPANPPEETVAAEAATDAATEQTTCPVMEGPINKDYYTVYEGKKVYFCCPGCEEEFAKNPEKYVKDLPQFQ